MTADGFSASDRAHMQRALALAECGLFTSMPNPRVGCVLVREGSVVGEGYHARAGEPHAEVFALRAAGAEARGATAYVTLEPCSHHGRTPPCADALVAAGVARVVMASADPNPKVDGGGVRRLRAAGIRVDTGLLEDAARELNAGFFQRIERGRPFVRVKLAMSLDGRTALADGTSQWITGEAARGDVQRWRARSSAILTGSGTALVDDPRLTVRIEAAHQTPLRVVLDRALRTPAGSHLLDGTVPTLLFHAAAPPSVPAHNVAYEAVPTAAGGLDLSAILQRLTARDCNELQVEAGAVLGGALLAQGLVDELLIYVAPVLLGGDARPLLQLPPLESMRERWQLQLLEQVQIGADLRLRLRPRAAT